LTFKCSEDFVDGIASQLVVDVIDRKLGLVGRLVIDSVVNNHSLGGIRMMPDVTLNELSCLARNMTLKFGFWGIPMGGAKSCIFASDMISEEKRHQLLACFGRILAPVLTSGVYIPAEDMGSTLSDVEYVLTSAGVRVRSNEPESHQTQDARYTSWTMLASAKTAALHVGLDLARSDIAVEGFGKVGAEAALAFSKSGARLVAISTIKGAISDPSGLDVDKLLEMRKKFGADMVNKYPARRISRSDIHRLEVAIFMPCDGPWSINASNFERVKARIICPGANIPFTPKVEEAMRNRRIFCIPDIVANSGGAFGGHLASFASEQKIRAVIDSQISMRLQEIINRAEARNVTLGKVAREMSMQRFIVTKRKAEQNIILKTNLFRSWAKILPTRVKNLIAAVYLKRVLSV
jgi:glutamate dehydrogenase/leucine dehydrogenase